MNPISSSFKLGIIAGGQLGKMLALACSNWDIKTYILDSEPNAPASKVCDTFILGKYSDYNDVYQFGKQVDVLTLELEHVNIQALLDLKKEGKIIHPDPEKLQIIQDKGLQKAFFEQHQLPSSSFVLMKNKAEILEQLQSKKLSYPFIQKSRTMGYDGKGVVAIHGDQDQNKIMDVPSVIEPLINIQKELSVIVAQNSSGETKAYPAVEMVFNKDGNLVDMLKCPAQISSEIEKKATEIALKTIHAFNICGLLAVELFLDQNNQILINEVAPRPHNSGHHTIESHLTSQFEQHIRGVLNFPLGKTQSLSPAVMLNLLGEKGHSGEVFYKNIEACLKVEGAKFHIYGKKTTKPLRKMGHVTILDSSIENAYKKADYIKNTLKIITHE